MASKIETNVLDGLNYVICAIDIEMLLENKGLWKYTKVLIPNPFDAQEKFVIARKKDEVVGVITTYISCEIWFQTSGIDCPHEV